MKDHIDVMRRLAQLAEEMDGLGEHELADQTEVQMAPARPKPDRLNSKERHQLNRLPSLLELNRGTHDEQTTSRLWRDVMSGAEVLGVLIEPTTVPSNSDTYETEIRYDHPLSDAATGVRIENSVFIRNLYAREHRGGGDRIEFTGYFS